MSLTGEVKMFMYNKGADLVGICRAEKNGGRSTRPLSLCGNCVSACHKHV